MKKTIGIIVLVLLVSNIGFAEKNVRISGGTAEDFSAKQTLSESELNELKIKAENNDINSQIELYYYYSASELYEDAFYWIEQAAIQGDPIAQNNLGYMYEWGEFIGDKRALNKRGRKLISNEEIPPPSREYLIKLTIEKVEDLK